MVKSKKKAKVSPPEDIFVSIVAIVTQDTRGLSTFVKDVSRLVAKKYANYEIILVDNGANRSQIEDVSALLASLPCIRIISLSRQSHYDTAVFAGLEVAIGDFVCTMNSSVDPIDAIVKIIKQNQQHDVVQGVSSIPINGIFGGQIGRRLFYWYSRKYVGVDIPLNATFFAAYSRAAVNTITATGRVHRHIRHLVRLIGYRPVDYLYKPNQNPGRHRSLRTGVIEALEIATNYSTHPLRFVTWLGLFAGVLNILYVAYVIIVNITRARITEGWTTTSLQSSGMFFVLFIIMVVLAEYIGRILVESRHESQYYITEERGSIVSLADTTRRNISQQ